MDRLNCLTWEWGHERVSSELKRLGRAPSITNYSVFHINHTESAYAYPHKASRTPRKHPITLQHMSLPPRICPTDRIRTRSASCRGAFNVVVEAFDYVAGTRLFEVGGFVAEDLVFESSLGGERSEDMHNGSIGWQCRHHVLVQYALPL